MSESDLNPATATPPEENSAPVQTPEVRQFSRKVESLAANPGHRGAFFTEDASARDLALVTAKYKDLKVYWLIDPQSDLIYDAKFFSYGGPLSVAMGEALCSLARGMNVYMACDISREEIENLLRDEPDVPATGAAVGATRESPLQPPNNLRPGPLDNLPLLLATIREAYPAAKALALASLQLKQQTQQQPSARKTPFENLTEADEAWLKKSKEEQLAAIEAVLTSDIRPGLNMDGGDLNIMDLENGTKLTVKYQGACGNCGSSVGATLFFIEDVLRRKIYSGMQVVPVDVPDSFGYPRL
jgi:NifU-like protein